MKNIPALDGLRGVAVMIVMTSHVFTERIPGAYGVTLFFFISGFIITKMMLSQSFSSAHFKAFYVRRVFRLAPALLVFMLATAIATTAIGCKVPWPDFAATLFYYANYHQYQELCGLATPFNITWSLAVEEHFYFVFPLALVLSRGRLIRFLLAIVTLILLWRMTLTFGLHVHKGNIGRGTDTRLDSIAWGCLLSALVHVRSRHLEWISSSRTLIVALVLSVVDFAIRDDRYRQTLHYTVQGMALVPVFHALFVSHRWLNRVERVLETRPLVFVGKISYSLYLYHFLVLECVTLIMPPGILRYAIVVIGGFAAATLSWRFVETPLRRFGSRLAKSLEKPASGPQVALTTSVAEASRAE
jgi:peptidoglycan/LPS O-acetylase OafA/YrhL